MQVPVLQSFSQFNYPFSARAPGLRPPGNLILPAFAGTDAKGAKGGRIAETLQLCKRPFFPSFHPASPASCQRLETEKGLAGDLSGVIQRPFDRSIVRSDPRRGIHFRRARLRNPISLLLSAFQDFRAWKAEASRSARPAKTPTKTPRVANSILFQSRLCGAKRWLTSLIGYALGYPDAMGVLVFLPNGPKRRNHFTKLHAQRRERFKAYRGVRTQLVALKVANWLFVGDWLCRSRSSYKN